MHHRFVAIACCVSLLAACSGATGGTARRPAQAGTARIVTLVPSFADDIAALGAQRQLAGVSAFTDAAGTKELPRVADASSVDDEAIIALQPSVVVGIPAQARLVEPLRRARLRVVLLRDDSYDSIFANLRAIGTLTGREKQAAATVARLRRETARLVARTRSFARRPSVFVVLGTAPIWTAGAGSYISTLIRLAGGTNAAGDLPAPYGEYSAEALLRRQPDLLVADVSTHLELALDREPWRSLDAVQRRRFYAVDPRILERPGPSYNDGLQWLIERIAPLAQRRT